MKQPSPTIISNSNLSTKTITAKALLTACYLTSSTTVSTKSIINPLTKLPNANTLTTTTTTTSTQNRKNNNIPKSQIIQNIPRGGEISSSDDYYKILGISKNATPTEIKKAYRRKALETHPDKTNSRDRTQFDLVSEAYNVLSDEEKRVVYDRFGKAGIEGHTNGSGEMSHHNFAEDIFHNFFGGRSSTSNFFGGGSRRRPVNKVRYQIQVTLEELYKGTSKRVLLPNSNNPNQQSNKKKELKVDIQAGMKSGERITFPGEYESTLPSQPPGDIIFIIQQVPHSIYTRKNYDLALRMNISLKESICGFTKTIPCLDGSPVKVQYTPDDNDIPIVSKLQHSSESGEYFHLFVVKGKGMPKHHSNKNSRHGHDNSNMEYGDLYVQCNVQIPTSTATTRRKRGGGKLTKDERIQLGTLLDKLFHENSSSTPPSTTTEKDIMQLEENASIQNFGFEQEQDYEEEANHFFSDDEEDVDFPSSHHRHGFSSFGNMFDHMHNSQQQNNMHNDNVQCQQM